MFFSTETRPTYIAIGLGSDRKALSRGRNNVHVDAARPAHDIAEAAAFEQALHRWRRDHRACGCAMKATQIRITQGERNRRARAHILGELRVIRRRERLAVAHAPRARGGAERAFGRDVHGVGIEFIERVDSLRYGSHARRISGYVGHGNVRNEVGSITCTS